MKKLAQVLVESTPLDDLLTPLSPKKIEDASAFLEGEVKLFESLYEEAWAKSKTLRDLILEIRTAPSTRNPAFARNAKSTIQAFLDVRDEAIMACKPYGVEISTKPFEHLVRAMELLLQGADVEKVSEALGDAERVGTVTKLLTKPLDSLSRRLVEIRVPFSKVVAHLEVLNGLLARLKDS
jgi:hypothetical protein